MISVFWTNLLIKMFSFWMIQYATGNLVFHMGVKVNYTRKINHFMLFFLPMYIDRLIPFQQSTGWIIMGSAIAVFSLVIYIRPLRTKIPLIARMFLSFDRPEDRPHTLFWLSTQITAGYLVIIPMIFLFSQKGYMNLILIPIFINGIGDGLAEPVGIKFGRLKYQTYAFFSKKKYTRTLEGSACVFITSIIVVLVFKPYFNPEEFIVTLIALPFVMTLAEAFAPHTWDTPFLFFAGYLTLYLIKSIYI